jgi:hypothetical protein
MEERSKTIMCSVLFLDIVEYSKKSVSGQIALKERFNAFLSIAIRDVPLDDRIILDTGDGAALSFLGDVEDALQAALSLRESLRNESINVELPLLVRMGINIGPVRLVKDINGQPNIVGDGINVAQRIMAFSDPGQILVSRSYYDAVSRLSPEYGEMFHYQGSRTDKHVREHEVYAIGYPGEFTAQQPAAGKTGVSLIKWRGLQQRVAKAWQGAAQLLGDKVQAALAGYRAATPARRAAYGGAAAGIVVLLVAAAALFHRGGAPSKPPAVADQQQVAVDSGMPAASQSKPATSGQAVAPEHKAPAAKKAEPPAGKTSKTPKPSKAPKSSKPAEKAPSEGTAGSQTSIFGVPLPAPKGKPGFLAITCMEGSTVFVDGFSKGVVGKASLNITLDPGKHQLTITHPSKSSVYAEAITIKTGETTHLHPAFCQ